MTRGVEGGSAPAVRIGLVSGKKQHYFELARRLDDAGLLARFWCGLCFPADMRGQGASRRILRSAMSRFARRKLATFTLEGVEPSRVASEPWTPLLAAATHRALGRLGWGNVFHNELFDRWAARGVRKFAEPLDIVHACNSHALRVGAAAKARGAKLVFDHGAANRAFETDLLADEYPKFGLPPLGRANDLQTRKQERELALADYVVCPSDYSKRSFVAKGFAEDRVFVCPYGVDAEKFAPPDGKSQAGARDVFRVLYIGGDHVRKGVPHLIAAMDRLAGPKVELVLVAPNVGVIQPLLREAKGAVRVIDFLSHAELASLIQTCSVFCLPSISDGFGMVVYEAMAGGLPAVVSENVGAPVRDGVDGFVVPIRDADALADRLRSLRDDPLLRERMGNAAIERAREQTWEAYFDAVLAAYAAILAR